MPEPEIEKFSVVWTINVRHFAFSFKDTAAPFAKTTSVVSFGKQLQGYPFGDKDHA